MNQWDLLDILKQQHKPLCATQIVDMYYSNMTERERNTKLMSTRKKLNSLVDSKFLKKIERIHVNVTDYFKRGMPRNTTFFMVI